MRTTVKVNVSGRRVFSRDAAGPAPLYVCRPLLNGAAVAAWARSAGLADVEPAGEMHVTLIYSRSPVDWFKFGESYSGEIGVPPGGPRRLEVFGSPGKQVVALRFTCSSLNYRNDEFRRGGCSADWPEYQPHVTVARGAGGADIDTLVAYSGELRFGPEVFGPAKV